MANQPWLDEVREQLVRQALPSAYIKRFTEELSDHLEDFKEECLEADIPSRLGDPSQIASAAVAAYRRHSFFGRHPLLTFPLAVLIFAISPAISHFVLLIASMMALFVFSGLHTFDWSEHPWSIGLTIAASSTFLSVLYSELALRLGISRRWALASCVVLAAGGMLSTACFSPYTALLQPAIPLVVGWWFTKGNRNHQYAAIAIKVFVLAISPVAGHMLFFYIVALAISIVQPLLSSPNDFISSHLGTTTLLIWSFMPSLVLYIIPTILASFLYCKFARRFNIGGTWMFVSCTALAMYAAMLSYGMLSRCYEQGFYLQWISMIACIVPTQFLVPLAIGWWFMRRTRDQDRLQLAL